MKTIDKFPGETYDRWLDNYDDSYDNCEENGHKWRILGSAEDGDTFVKCRVCGLEECQ